jgi:hypothetical protein
MAVAADHIHVEAVVDDHGNLVMPVVPTERLARRYPSGSQVAVDVVVPVAAQPKRLPVENVLPDLPELSWDDFERASQAATADAERGLDQPG